MIDRPHLEIDRLEAAEGAFGGRELFVGGDRGGLIERRFGDSGAHHIDAVECRFGVDFGGVARKGETVVSDIQIKMFGHFVFVDDAADRELGSRITRLHPVQGFCAEAGGAATLFLATAFGIPVSTTHTITGAIVGVGAARKVAAVRWNVASNVVVAWILTMPAAALIGAIFYKLYD